MHANSQVATKDSSKADPPLMRPEHASVSPSAAIRSHQGATFTPKQGTHHCCRADCWALPDPPFPQGAPALGSYSSSFPIVSLLEHHGDPTSPLLISSARAEALLLACAENSSGVSYTEQHPGRARAVADPAKASHHGSPALCTCLLPTREGSWCLISSPPVPVVCYIRPNGLFTFYTSS
jgi:hypothetical protein